VLKTLAPAVRRVWLVYYQVDLGSTPMITKAIEAAQRMKLELVAEGAPRRQRSQASCSLKSGRDDALLAPEGSNPDLTIAIIERRGPCASRPSSGRRSGSATGGLISYGPDLLRAVACRRPRWSQRSCVGRPPQDLPVEAPRRSISR
jgi:hypothetical protein